MWSVEFNILICRMVYFISHNSDSKGKDNSSIQIFRNVCVYILRRVTCVRFSYSFTRLTKLVSNLVYYLI
jgi:hypothetical protein